MLLLPIVVNSFKSEKKVSYLLTTKSRITICTLTLWGLLNLFLFCFRAQNHFIQPPQLKKSSSSTLASKTASAFWPFATTSSASLTSPDCAKNWQSWPEVATNLQPRSLKRQEEVSLSTSSLSLQIFQKHFWISLVKSLCHGYNRHVMEIQIYFMLPILFLSLIVKNVQKKHGFTLYHKVQQSFEEL